MAYHDRRLDRIVLHVQPGRRCRCGAARCRCGLVEAAAPRPPATATRLGTPRTGTREGPLTLHDWGGWGSGVILKELVAAARYVDSEMATRFGTTKRSTPLPVPRDLLNRVPPAFHPYFTRTGTLYRIETKGQPVPVDIGMVTSQVAGFRLLKHFVPPAQVLSGAAKYGGAGRYAVKRGTPPRRLIADAAAAAVHLGRFRKRLHWRGRPDRRLLHAYEILLQWQERTRTYNPQSWTFED